MDRSKQYQQCHRSDEVLAEETVEPFHLANLDVITGQTEATLLVGTVEEFSLDSSHVASETEPTNPSEAETFSPSQAVGLPFSLDALNATDAAFEDNNLGEDASGFSDSNNGNPDSGNWSDSSSSSDPSQDEGLGGTGYGDDSSGGGYGDGSAGDGNGGGGYGDNGGGYGDNGGNDPSPEDPGSPVEIDWEEFARNTSEFVGAWHGIYDRFEHRAYGYRPATILFPNPVLTRAGYSHEVRWQSYWDYYNRRFYEVPPIQPPNHPEDPDLTYLQKLTETLNLTIQLLEGEVDASQISEKLSRFILVGSIVDPEGEYRVPDWAMKFLFNPVAKAKGRDGLPPVAAAFKQFLLSDLSPEAGHLIYASQLLTAAELVPQTSVLLNEQKFALALAEFGQAYADLTNYKIADPNFFLDHLWDVADVDGMQRTGEAFARFLEGVDDPLRLIQFETTLLKMLKQSASFPGLHQGEFLKELLDWGKAFVQLHPSGFIADEDRSFVAELAALIGATGAELTVAAQKFDQFFLEIAEPLQAVRLER